jgi:hypothetical protein
MQYGAVHEESYGMFSRILGVLMLTGGVMFGVTGITHAGERNRDPNYCPPGATSAPELDPTALASGVAMLIGGVLVLNERRRKHQ